MHDVNTKLSAGAFAAAIMMSAAATLPAKADDTVTSSRVVSLQGLSLSAVSGQQALRHRLLVAASQVCTDGDGGPDLNSAGYLECRSAAFGRAWAQAEVLVASATSRSRMAAKAAPVAAQPARLIASVSAPDASPGR